MPSNFTRHRDTQSALTETETFTN